MSKTLSSEMSVEHVRRYIAERDQRLQVASYPSESAEPEAHIQLLQQTNAKLDHLSVNLERLREELSHFNRLLREEVEGARPVAKEEPAIAPELTTPEAVASPEPVAPMAVAPAVPDAAGERPPEPTPPARPGDNTRRAGEPVTAIPPAPYGGRWLARVVVVCTVVLLGTAAGLGFYEWKAGRVAQLAVTTEQSLRLAR